VLITKIKSIDRVGKINWQPSNATGLNLIIAPHGWGKTHLMNFIMKAWVGQAGNNLDYRIEAENSKRQMFVIGSKDQSIYSMGMNASMQSGKDGILYYPGSGRRMLHANLEFGCNMRAAAAPLADMKIGMQNSVLIVDDADFGLDAQNAAEYLNMLHTSARSRGNQVIATSSRRELASLLDSSVFMLQQADWTSLKRSLESMSD
jgi:hypothetical protein